MNSSCVILSHELWLQSQIILRLCKTCVRGILLHVVVSCPNIRVSRELLFHSPEIGSYFYNQFGHNFTCLSENDSYHMLYFTVCI